jgi:spore coat protein U-like protein
MKHWASLIGATWTIMLAGTAAAEVSCSMAVTDVRPIYTPSQNAHSNATGSITLTCTRTANESSTDYWIGIQAGNLRMQRQTGTETLTYAVFSDSNYGTVWDNGKDAVSGNLKFNGPVASRTIPYYLRIPRTNKGNPPGLYDDMLVVTLRFRRNGADISSAVLNPVASILAECRVSSAPTPLSLHYPSFSKTAVSASASFDVSCTNTTWYAMTLDAYSGNLFGLQYNLGLSALSGTGTALPQTYSITATIPANQSGSCATGICSGTRVHTITITY